MGKYKKCLLETYGSPGIMSRVYRIRYSVLFPPAFTSNHAGTRAMASSLTHSKEWTSVAKDNANGGEDHNQDKGADPRLQNQSPNVPQDDSVAMLTNQNTSTTNSFSADALNYAM